VDTASAIIETLRSVNVADSNFEAANVVDTIQAVANSVRLNASAITPLDTGPGTDAAGGTITSLTEAVMGVTAGLMAIASAVEHLAEQDG
jgi:hypothetical protein